MSENNLGTERAEALIGNSVVWVPPVTEGTVWGRAAIIAARALAEQIIITSGGGGDRSAGNASQSNDAGSSAR